MNKGTQVEVVGDVTFWGPDWDLSSATIAVKAEERNNEPDRTFRTQLDTAHLEMQQLQVKNEHNFESQPGKAALVDVRKEVKRFCL